MGTVTVQICIFNAVVFLSCLSCLTRSAFIATYQLTSLIKPVAHLFSPIDNRCEVCINSLPVHWCSLTVLFSHLEFIVVAPVSLCFDFIPSWIPCWSQTSLDYADWSVWLNSSCSSLSSNSSLLHHLLFGLIYHPPRLLWFVFSVDLINSLITVCLQCDTINLKDAYSIFRLSRNTRNFLGLLLAKLTSIRFFLVS